MVRKVKLDGFEYQIEGKIVGLIVENKNSYNLAVKKPLILDLTGVSE